MPADDGTFVQRLPDWLRWIIVPYAMVVGYLVAAIPLAVVRWTIVLSVWLSWLDWLVVYLVMPSVAAFLAVIVGVLVAPKYKFITSLILGAVFLLIGGLGMYLYAVVELNFGMLMANLSGWVGAGIAILKVEHDNNTFY